MRLKVSVSKGSAGLSSWARRVESSNPSASLRNLGQNGVNKLRVATPKRTGATSRGWYYEVNKTRKGYDLIFKNNAHPESKVSVAMLLQYGHGNGRGGYTPPIDYINPALLSIFNEGVDKLTKEVIK